MSKEAMQLALEALETERVNYKDWDEEDGAPEYIHEAITALREALAEPDFWEGYVPEPDKRQQALDKMAENARELGLDYEPAPMSQPNRVIAYSAAMKLRELGYEWMNDKWKHLDDLAEQPAQRTWVYLPDAERQGLWRVIIGWGDPSHNDEDLMKAIEDASRRKNT